MKIQITLTAEVEERPKLRFLKLALVDALCVETGVKPDKVDYLLIIDNKIANNSY